MLVRNRQVHVPSLILLAKDSKLVSASFRHTSLSHNASWPTFPSQIGSNSSDIVIINNTTCNYNKACMSLSGYSVITHAPTSSPSSGSAVRCNYMQQWKQISFQFTDLSYILLGMPPKSAQGQDSIQYRSAHTGIWSFGSFVWYKRSCRQECKSVLHDGRILCL